MLSILFRKQAIPLALLMRPCLRGYSSSPLVGPNEELIQVLSRYVEEEKASASPNLYKVRAYSKAITTIGQLAEQVRSVEQVRHLSGIGARIAKRIDAYLSNSPYEPLTLPRSRKTKSPDRSLTEHARSKRRKTLEELRREQVVSLLSSINGVGSSKANALYGAGCRSLEDLTQPKFLEMLSRTQQLNVQYMIGLDQRMTREQASAVSDFVTQNISSKFSILLSGDFRRGIANAQHITLVVFHPQPTGVFPPEGPPNLDSTIKQRSKSETVPSPFASHSKTKVKSKDLDTTTFSAEIISPLECRGLIATTTSAGTQRWTGIIRIPERTEGEGEGNGWETRAERIQGVQIRKGLFFSAEICYVPCQCAGAASIALTGDDQFNLAVRKAASRLGYRLNEYGLWRWQAAGGTSTPVEDVEKYRSIKQYDGYWKLVAGEREEDILEAIGMEWVSPERRNFGNLAGRLRKRKTEE